MTDTTMTDPNITARSAPVSFAKIESYGLGGHPLVSWRSVIAGLLVSMLSLAILLALGMAVGGISLIDSGTSTMRAEAFTGIWFLVASTISLLIGGYFAARVSTFHTARVGAVQGMVITGVFFAVLFWQSFMFAGWTAHSIAEMGTAVAGASAQMPMVTSTEAWNGMVEDSIGDMNLRAPVGVVAAGVSSRLLRGDTDAAKLYLSRMSDLTPEEVDARVVDLRTRLDATLTQAREIAARTLRAVGISVCATLVLGLIAALAGGTLGSRRNLRRPLVREIDSAASEGFMRPAYTT